MVPSQKPRRSRQDYGTPPEFLAAVRRLLCIDGFTIDLAASTENAVTTIFYSAQDDALAQSWPTWGWCWLNPPFAHIRPWVQKAYEEREWGTQTAVLIPAAVGANWWRDWVHQKARVLLLNGRLTFVGCPTVYPKDCALLLYSYNEIPGYEVWEWTREKSY